MTTDQLTTQPDAWHRLTMFNAARDLINAQPTVSAEVAEHTVLTRMLAASPNATSAASVLANEGGWLGVVREIHRRMTEKARMCTDRGAPVSPSIAHTLANAKRILAGLKKEIA